MKRAHKIKVKNNDDSSNGRYKYPLIVLIQLLFIKLIMYYKFTIAENQIAH